MENKDNQYVDFVVTARKYKTLLTEKYKNRPVWVNPVLGEIKSTLPGTVMQIAVKEGQEVKEGQLVLIQEAMKMQNRIVSPVDGVVKALHVKEGEQIGKNILMVTISPE